MSKITIVFIAAFLVLTLLAGCAQATPAGSVPPTSANSGYPADSGKPTIPVDQTASAGYPAPIESTSAAPVVKPGYPAPEGNGLQIVTSGGTTNTVSMAQLNDLPKATVGNESGPKLIDVLEFSNIFDFSTVTITGSNGSKDLTKDQVNGQIILGLANNTVSLVIDGASSDQAIKDITVITVK